MSWHLPPDPPEAAIVVTARALPPAESERAYAVERIDARRLASAPSGQADQILKDFAGVQLFRRADARSSHPTNQGVTLRALGGTASSRALVLLDGVPQSDPFGGWISWPAYDPASLAEVRLTRGGGSVASGPGALAGTVAMTSRLDAGVMGALDVGGRGAVEGSAVAGDGRVVIAARAGRGDGFVPVTRATRGPVDRAAPYEEASVRALGVIALGETLDLQLAALGFTDRRDRGVDFTANRTDGADASVRLVGSGRWQWSALGYAQWRRFDSSFASVGAGRASVARASLQDKVPAHGLGGSVEVRPPTGRALDLRLGGDVRLADGRSNELYSYVAGAATRRRAAGGESATAGLFAEATLRLERVTLSGGARIDRWHIRDGMLREATIATGVLLRDEVYPDRSGWRPTARAGARIDAGRGVALRSAAYLGWRLPTLNELFRPFRVGQDATAANALLDPERLAGVEVGGEVERGPVSAALTLFANRLDDAIANVTLGTGPGTFPGVGFVGAGGTYRQRQNIAAVNVRGVEASARFEQGPWSLGGSLSIARARVEGDGAATPLDGLRPAQTPRFAGTLSGGWEHGRRSARIVIRRVGGQYEDDLNQRLLEGATTLDAFAAWPLTRRLQLVGRAENLADARVITGIGGDGAVERATPRTLWIGIRLARRD